MKPARLQVAGFIVGCMFLCVPWAATAWELAGTKTITLHTREGGAVPIGTVRFEPQGERLRFSLQLERAQFTDFFLSMREFKCLEGKAEVQCHVPYPYAQPMTVTADDLAWLEHALLFFYKTPRDFGARLWNGLYYRLKRTDSGLVGTPQAIDLEYISSPPDDLSVPPYGPQQRSEIDAESRWFSRMTIE